jgi:cyclophilin family peptidyl-prolyl cis-trans isomerase
MRKASKYLIAILITLIIIAGVGSLFYFNTKNIETCEKALQRFSENHLCLSTNKGNMIFEIYPDAAPNAVKVMTNLANEKKFYDGLELYRVLKDSLVQGGIQDYRIRNIDIDIKDSTMKEKVRVANEDIFDVETNFDKLEFAPELRTQLETAGYKTNPALNTRPFEYGSLAFANKGEKEGPNTNSTEFFILTAKDKASEDVQYLNGRFTNFGKLVEGEDVLNTINNLEINAGYIYAADATKTFETVEIYEIRVK